MSDWITTGRDVSNCTVKHWKKVDGRNPKLTNYYEAYYLGGELHKLVDTTRGIEIHPNSQTFRRLANENSRWSANKTKCFVQVEG